MWGFRWPIHRVIHQEPQHRAPLLWSTRSKCGELCQALSQSEANIAQTSLSSAARSGLLQLHPCATFIFVSSCARARVPIRPICRDYHAFPRLVRGTPNLAQFNRRCFSELLSNQLKLPDDPLNRLVNIVKLRRKRRCVRHQNCPNGATSILYPSSRHDFDDDEYSTAKAVPDMGSLSAAR